MPASKVLETSLVCTRSARFVLCSGINDDFICDKVEKKFLRNCKPRFPFVFCMMTVTSGTTILKNTTDFTKIGGLAWN
jgi:hypothetical protein